MATARFMSQSAFARKWGVSSQTVQNWRIRGHLAFAPNDKVDVALTEANLRQRPRMWSRGVMAGPAEDAATPREAVLAELRVRNPEASEAELRAAVTKHGVRVRTQNW